MNDIEILEWVCINKLYIDTHNECDYHDIYKAIENLIQRNKNLEQIEKEHKEENGRLRNKIKELEKIDLTTVYMSGFYDGEKKWKDKIKDKIEELENEQKENQKNLQKAIDLLWNAEIDKILINLSFREILQSLLEKGGDKKCMK